LLSSSYQNPNPAILGPFSGLALAAAHAAVVLGVGAGQQSRVDCTKLARAKVDSWWLRRHDVVRSLAFRLIAELADVSLAADGFIPFRYIADPGGPSRTAAVDEPAPNTASRCRAPASVCSTTSVKPDIDS
jgi:hypothetical protein